jgi:nicotinamidase/pyrazinamidase
VKIHLFIIDGQNDFMDQPGATLPVKGACKDMERVAKLIERRGADIDDIKLTADSHQPFDVGHPMLWEDQNGKHPVVSVNGEPRPLVISVSDLENGIWRPRNAGYAPRELGNLTIGQYFINYAKALEKGGRYPLIVWPEHCILLTWGQNFYEPLRKAAYDWCRKYFATLTVVTKGSDPWAEHYGALQAEVPLPSDPSTGLRTDVLDSLAQADVIWVAGEASSHCVLSTINQVADNIGEKHISKFHLLTDCMSPVGAVPGIDFPQIAHDWMISMQKRGMTLTTSDKV